MDLVCDLERCTGNRLWDAQRGRAYLDMFTFYASRPLSFDHPALTDPEFTGRLGRLAIHKPSNCDVYTQEYASFVDAMPGPSPPPGPTSSSSAAAPWPWKTR